MKKSPLNLIIFLLFFVVFAVYFYFFYEKPVYEPESSQDSSQYFNWTWSDDYDYDAFYPYDKNVNNFLEEYNKIATYTAMRDNTEKGNIDCKVFVQAGDVYLELIVRDDGYIFATGENDIDTGKDLFTVFYDVARTIEPSLTYAEAEQAWDLMQSGSIVAKNMKCLIASSIGNNIRFEISYPADKLGG